MSHVIMIYILFYDVNYFLEILHISFLKMTFEKSNQKILSKAKNYLKRRIANYLFD